MAAQVEDLARLSFKHAPLYVGVDDGQAHATREGLEQGYCVVPADKRFLLLFTFLKKNLKKKVMVRAPFPFPLVPFSRPATRRLAVFTHAARTVRPASPGAQARTSVVA